MHEIPVIQAPHSLDVSFILLSPDQLDYLRHVHTGAIFENVHIEEEGDGFSLRAEPWLVQSFVFSLMARELMMATFRREGNDG